MPDVMLASPIRLVTFFFFFFNAHRHTLADSHLSLCLTLNPEFFLQSYCLFTQLISPTEPCLCLYQNSSSQIMLCQAH